MAVCSMITQCLYYCTKNVHGHRQKARTVPCVGMAKERKPLTGKRRHAVARMDMDYTAFICIISYDRPGGPHECCACRPWPLQRCLSSSYVYARRIRKGWGGFSANTWTVFSLFPWKPVVEPVQADLLYFCKQSNSTWLCLISRWSDLIWFY